MLKAFFIFFLLFMLISAIWTLAEKFFYGRATPMVLHDVIAIILSISLYHNIKHLIYFF